MEYSTAIPDGSLVVVTQAHGEMSFAISVPFPIGDLIT